MILVNKENIILNDQLKIEFFSPQNDRKRSIKKSVSLTFAFLNYICTGFNTLQIGVANFDESRVNCRSAI